MIHERASVHALVVPRAGFGEAGPGGVQLALHLVGICVLA
jgi:hypothetical protein